MATEPGNDEELLAAYLDGVGELTPAERKRVEQRLDSDPALKRDADELRAVLDRARGSATSATASEPDWLALERQIREAVGPTVAMPWYRRMRWLAPVSTLATTAAIALLWLHHTPTDHAAISPTRDAAIIAPLAIQPAIQPAPTPVPAAAPTAAIYIDGQVIDVSNVDPEALIDDDTSDTGTADASSSSGLLPATDYGWVDNLDDKAMERAERWLARKKG